MDDHNTNRDDPWLARQGPLLAAIVLLGLALRLYGLGAYSLWYDESTSLFAIQYVDWNLTFLQPGDETRLIPLNTLLLFFWYHAVDALPGVEMGTAQSDYLLKLLPLSFGVLCIPLVFLFGKLTTERAGPGLVAAFLVAISPFQLYYAQELRPHTLYAFLVLAALYFNYRALEENRPRFWIASVLVAAASFYAYYFSVFYMAAVNLYVLLFFKHYQAVLKRWILSQIAVGVLIIPAVLLALAVFLTVTSAEERWFPYPTVTTLGITVKTWFAGYSPRSWAYWPLFALGGGAIGAGAVALRNRPRVAAFLVINAFVPLVLQYIFWNTQSFPFYTMRIQLAYAMPALVLAGAGLTGFRLAPAWTRALAFAGIVVFTAPTLADFYAQRIHPIMEHRMGARYKVDSRGAADIVQANWREGDIVAHASTVTFGPFYYHYLDAPQAFVGFGEEEWTGHLKSFPDKEIWESFGAHPRRVEEFAAEADRIWYVKAWWEPTELFRLGTELRTWFDAHGVRVDTWYLDGVSVYLFDMRDAVRERATIDWIADLGWEEVPLVRGLEAGATPYDAPRVAPDELPPAYDPAALDVWFEPTDDGTILRYEPDANAYSLRLHLRNRSVESRSIEIDLRGAAEIVHTAAFDRDSELGAWRLTHSLRGKVAAHARLRDGLTTASIEKQMEFAAGQRVFVQVLAVPDGNRATLEIGQRFPNGVARPLAKFPGDTLAGTEERAWRWMDAGEPSTDAVSLSIEARLPSDRTEAYADLGYVAIVPPTMRQDGLWQPVSSATADLRPSSEHNVAMEIPTSELTGETNVLFIEVSDTTFGTYRVLRLHLPGEGGPNS